MIRRRTPLKRSTKPIARSSTPLKRSAISRKPTKRAMAKTQAMRDAKDLYFKPYGKGEAAPCQYCGGKMFQDDCAAHHKIKRSLGGKHGPENLVVIHHKCHAFIHELTELYIQVRDSSANARNGKTV